MGVVTSPEISKLSQLQIDADKDWQGYNITNLGSQGYDVHKKLLEINKKGFGHICGTTEKPTINEQYDNITDTWSIKAYKNNSYDNGAGFSLSSYGYVTGGCYEGYGKTATERYDPISDSWQIKANLNQKRFYNAAFSLKGYAYTAGGQSSVTAGNLSSVERYDDIANLWTVKASLGTARRGLGAFSLDGYGYVVGGIGGSAITEQYDDVADSWTTKANLNTGRDRFAYFALNGYGYVAAGYSDGSKLNTILSGTAFTGGGNYLVRFGNRENSRFCFQSPKMYSVIVEDATDITKVGKAVVQLKPHFVIDKLGGDRFLVNVNMGLGFTAGGFTDSNSAVTEKYDDIANSWTTKANLNTARNALAGFSLNGYGYTAGGTGGTNVTEKYDDTADTWTTKANLNTARGCLAGFSLNGYGYTAGGYTSSNSAVTEKYDDIANSWTTKANLNTARRYLTGFSLNSYGYTAGGLTSSNSAVTEKYDDIANSWTTKANLNTARQGLAGFSLKI